jgi:hypothetical protein
MRLWSLHPKYLDSKGLVALWRETLLAKHVLEGKTKGYRNHPQLDRFKLSRDPLAAINYYLQVIHGESEARGYHFDKSKFKTNSATKKMKVTSGQIEYETEHLLRKLKVRDKEKFKELQKLKNFAPHPIFRIVIGKIADWEIVERKK